ncbi:MAG: UDP-N-acetylglucosamine 2-epimerase (non-hydrolyzing), partial [Bacteroidota bacterium]
SLHHILVHTGQHYDDRMSKHFFEELNLPNVDINLGIGSGTHAQQVGYTMIEFEKVLQAEKPDWVVVVGDVNATLACSVTAKKEQIKVCHIEAGLRSGDMSMPEEINRLVTDRMADLLLTPDRLSVETLRKEGVDEKKIRFVGNIMIDTLDANIDKAKGLSLNDIIKENQLIENKNLIKIQPDSYAMMTLHRPSNVDHEEVMIPLVKFIIHDLVKDMPLVWAIHPRTVKQLDRFGLKEVVENSEKLLLLNPVGYLEMLKLNSGAKIMLTDSGGLQEECTVLGTPCLTLRWNTERPITLTSHGGASVLVGNNIERIKQEYTRAIQLSRNPSRPELWDGNSATRCLQAIIDYQD